MAETENEILVGSCLCGSVRFEVRGPFKLFQYCHCSRCQKATGSAHAANLFVDSSQFTWLSGEDSLVRYRLEGAKHFGTVFCRDCGASLPWQTADGATTLVPAGGLDQPPSERPIQSIHWASRAEWYLSPDHLPQHAELPPRRK